MIHSLFGRKLGKRAGFTLIELAIVLAVTSLLTAGLWRMMASGNTQLRDQSSADQQRELITSIRGYLSSAAGQAALIPAGVLVDGSTFPVALGDANVIPFLPTSFAAGSTNSYGQTYLVRVRRTVNTASNTLTAYSFMIMTRGGDVIPDTSGGRISSMIGNDGGFNYGTPVCGPAGATACGAFGTWTAAPGGVYGFAGADVAAGHVASRTFVGMNAELNMPWLARLPMVQHDANGDGIDDFNTVATNLSLGGNTLFGMDGTGALGGRLINYAEITADRTTLAGNSPLHVTTTCRRAGIAVGDPCDYGASFDTDIFVAGLLTAKSLYAGGFLYDGTTSDERLKKEIKLIENPVDKMAQLKGYSFIMKDGKETRYGVMAQEVEKVYPAIVHEDAEGYKSVDYIGLIGPLVGAVNQLIEENKDLKASVEAQSRTIEKLEKRLDKKK